MNNYTFRTLNPRNDLDIKKYFDLVSRLSDFCNDSEDIDEDTIKWARVHMGAIEFAQPEHNEAPLPPLEENADEFVFVCEYHGHLVGYVEICAYHIVDGKRPNDDIGLLHEIFVLDEHRNGTIAYTLLQMAISKLIEQGKGHAICNVQEDNPNRFLHFAMANGNVINSEPCTRSNGATTIDYTLLIDLNKLKTLSQKEIGLKALQYRSGKKTLNFLSEQATQ